MRYSFLILLLLVVLGNFAMAQQGKVRAPELNGGKSWLNTDKPLSLQALRGKVVLLDFWTYGCINCIHIIPDLKKLEAKYADQLVVIGVHSAKFENESETENIRKIILRYELEHPVVNDADYRIWEQYAVKAYPTLVLIDPSGYVIKNYVGEGHSQEIENDISQIITEFRKKGQLNETPLKFALESAKVGNLPLAFPGKVLADAKSNRLFIADSNHHRIVITDLNGKLIETIGTGQSGLKNGNFQTAMFNRPQGLALDGDILYIADTENHAIRQVNLAKKQVEILTGNGKQAEWRSTGGDTKTAKLSSPWDLVKVGNALYIAMAGTHQIWKLDFAKQKVAPFAGSGAEARFDASIAESAFAQPSGIVSNGKKLWIADSESNIIREIDLETETVKTLVGGDLWEFGDKDGNGDDVRLQHPLGVTLYNGKILIADTYNHKIKELDAEKQSVKTFLGNGKTGQMDGAKPQFYEPAGLSIANDKLYIADTNNHAIRIVDLKNKQVSTLKIEGLRSPKEVSDESISFSPNLKELKLETQEVTANSQGSLKFNVNLPKGFHLNADAPSRFEIITESQNIKFEKMRGRFTQIPLTIPFQILEGESKLIAKFTFYYCRDDNTGECLIKTLSWSIPIKPIKTGKLEILLSGNVN